MRQILFFLVLFFGLFVASILSAQEPPPGSLEYRMMLEAEARRKMHEEIAISNQQASLNRMIRDPYIIQLLEQMSENPDFMPSVELLPDQRIKLKSIFRKYREDCERVKRDTESTQGPESSRAVIDQEVSKLTREMEKELKELLIKDQMLFLSSMSVDQAGFAKLLADSPFGEQLELTEQQRKKIREDSAGLAADIEEFIHKSRRRELQIIEENLAREQKAKLREFYSDEFLKAFHQGGPIDTIFLLHAVLKDGETTPLQRIFRTDLNGIEAETRKSFGDK